MGFKTRAVANLQTTAKGTVGGGSEECRRSRWKLDAMAMKYSLGQPLDDDLATRYIPWFDSIVCLPSNYFVGWEWGCEGDVIVTYTPWSWGWGKLYRLTAHARVACTNGM